jgi:hypothetical protein
MEGKPFAAINPFLGLASLFPEEHQQIVRKEISGIRRNLPEALIPGLDNQNILWQALASQ